MATSSASSWFANRRVTGALARTTTRRRSAANPSASGEQTELLPAAPAEPMAQELAQDKPAAISYTSEQAAVIADPSRLVIVKALAGTGKTTTAVGYAEAQGPQSRGLYLAFNKAIQMEASNRFGANTECKTTHAMAYRAVGYKFKDRLTFSWKPYTLMKEGGLPSPRVAAIVQKILLAYMHSDSGEIAHHHGDSARADLRANEQEIGRCMHYAKQHWRRMCDTTDRTSVPHDAYLKMWALSSPQLDYDFVIFDEAQDANPVTAQVMRAQKTCKLLYLGDPHQSIYAFHGATNAMANFTEGASHHTLTNTWRFGPNIARIANMILGDLKGESAQIIGLGKAGANHGQATAKIARTNSALFREAAVVAGNGIHWVGGVQGYNPARVLDAYNLSISRPRDVKDDFLRNFSSLSEVRQYANDVNDSDLNILCQIVDDYGPRIPKLVESVIKNAVPTAERATSIMTTAHKSKGLDFDHVLILDDFKVLDKAEAALADGTPELLEEQEINLLYVAVTRARKSLVLNAETRDWIRNLPVHRQNRIAAHARAVAAAAAVEAARPTGREAMTA